MTPLELSETDARIWSITLESSSMILEGSYTLIYDCTCIGITYDDWQSIIN